MIEKVNRIRGEFPGFTFVPMVADQNLIQKLKNTQLESVDCVFVIHPLIVIQDISIMVKEIPVYEIKYSMTALYKTLFKSLLTAKQESGSIKMSVDLLSEDKLQVEGISNAPLYIKEHHPDITLQELVDFHIRSYTSHNVKTIVTSHPKVVESLKDAPVKVELVTPTETCIREFLYDISKKIKAPSEFPIRYESTQAIEHFKKQGVSGATIYKLQCLCEAIGRNRITAAELAKGFSITLRSARRILTTLETQKVAKVVGEEQLNGRGRPRYVYYIDFNQMNEDAVPVAVMN